MTNITLVRISFLLLIYYLFIHVDITNACGFHDPKLKGIREKILESLRFTEIQIPGRVANEQNVQLGDLPESDNQVEKSLRKNSEQEMIPINDVYEIAKSIDTSSAIRLLGSDYPTCYQDTEALFVMNEKSNSFSMNVGGVVLAHRTEAETIISDHGIGVSIDSDGDIKVFQHGILAAAGFRRVYLYGTSKAVLRGVKERSNPSHRAFVSENAQAEVYGDIEVYASGSGAVVAHDRVYCQAKGSKAIVLAYDNSIIEACDGSTGFNFGMSRGKYIGPGTFGELHDISTGLFREANGAVSGQSVCYVYGKSEITANEESFVICTDSNTFMHSCDITVIATGRSKVQTSKCSKVIAKDESTIYFYGGSLEIESSRVKVYCMACGTINIKAESVVDIIFPPSLKYWTTPGEHVKIESWDISPNLKASGSTGDLWKSNKEFTIIYMNEKDYPDLSIFKKRDMMVF